MMNTNVSQPRTADGKFSFVDREDPGQAILLSDDVTKVLDHLRDAGLRPLLVGGAVRDALCGADPKDMDFEVYGGSPDDIERALGGAGYRTDMVGKAFGVVKVRTPEGTDLDLSVPRRDSKTGIGHRDFEMEFDTDMTLEEASARRDFTINAMAYDPETNEVLDPHGGQVDLGNRVLRHVSPAFNEDVLRGLRAVQFADRFHMRLHDDTLAACQELAREAHTLPDERVRTEWEKWIRKGRTLTQGYEVMHQTNWDKALGLHCRVRGLENIDREAVDDSTALVTGLVLRFQPPEKRSAIVKRLVEGQKRQHLALSLANDDRRLPRTEAEARTQSHKGIPLRYRLALGRALGVTGTGQAARVGYVVMDGPEEPLLRGRDLVNAGVKPGPDIGAVLKEAEQAQDAGVFRTREDAERWLGQRLGLPSDAPR